VDNLVRVVGFERPEGEDQVSLLDVVPGVAEVFGNDAVGPGWKNEKAVGDL